MSGFISRVREDASTLANTNEKNIAVFTHAGVIRFMICHFLGLDPSDYLKFDIGPASVTIITIVEGKGVLTGLIRNEYMRGEE